MSTSGIVGEAYLLIVSIIVLAGFSTVYYSSYSSIGEAVRMEALEARERVEKKLVIAAVNYDAGRGVLEVYLKRVVEAGGRPAAGGTGRLEEVLSLYSDLLREMERLRQRLGEKLF